MENRKINGSSLLSSIMETPDTISIEVSSIKTPEDILKQGIEILNLDPDISIKPSDDSINTQVSRIECTIREIVQNRLKGLETKLNITDRALDETLYWLMPEIEQTWQTQFIEQLGFRILDLPKYLKQINELEGGGSLKPGVRYVIPFFPYACLSPFQGVILLPSEFPVGFSGRYSIGTKWDPTHFREVLCGILSQALFRQVRGEWRSDYVKARRSLQSEFYKTSFINDIIAQHIKEKLALKHPEWAAYVFLDQVGVVWGGEQMRRDGMNRTQEYAAIDVLENVTSVYKTAMVDDIGVFVDQKKVLAMFNQNHPNYQKKLDIFKKG